MNVLSLFDGMACGLEALKRAGYTVDNYLASEIDPYAIKIALKNHPEIRHIGNVSNVRYTGKTHIDLLIGGSPCQGFSFAGKGLNFEDPRSKLFFEYVRLLNEIRQYNPDVEFLLENVFMRAEWQDVISEYLGVRPITINASLVSAQNRKRLFWTNISGVDQPKERGLFYEHIEDHHGPFQYLTPMQLIRASLSARSRISGNGKKMGQARLYIKPDQKCRCLVVLKDVGARDTNRVIDKGGMRILTPVECERLQTLPDNYTQGVSNTQRYKMLGNGWSIETIVHILKYSRHGNHD